MYQKYRSLKKHQVSNQTFNKRLQIILNVFAAEQPLGWGDNNNTTENSMLLSSPNLFGRVDFMVLSSTMRLRH